MSENRRVGDFLTHTVYLVSKDKPGIDQFSLFRRFICAV